MKHSYILLGLAVSLFLQPLQTIAQRLEHVLPEQVGLSSQQLALADSALNAEIDAKAIPGAVLAVVRHGKMAYLKAYGNRSIYPKVEQMTTETIFDMASCSKVVGTATSVMQLLEQGRLRLLDPVNRYIPNFKNWKDGTNEEETIRIIHLLTHTSGLPAYATAATLAKEHGSPNPKAMMDYIATCNRLSSPEEKFRYSCLNFITLQNIVQNISGQSLKDYTRQHIFEPLGMYHSCYQPADSLLPIVAPTEKQPDGSVLRGQVHDPLARIMNGGISGNAGLFTCAEDLGIFTAMLLNGGEWNNVRILSPNTVKALTTIPRGYERFGRALGWDVCSPYSSCNGDFFSKSTFGHTGYTGTGIVVDPENDMAVILLIHSVHPTDGHGVVRLRSVISNIVASAVQAQPRNYCQHYYDRCRQFMDEPNITSQDIVMLGNSLTEGGGDWGKILHAKHIVNRGVSGDEALGILDRLDPIVQGKPKAICLMIGINDVSHNASNDSLLSNIRLIVRKIRQCSPRTRLILQSMLPINESPQRYQRLKGKTDLIPQLNKGLQNIAKEENADWLDLFPLFKESHSNSLRLEFSTDGLHLNKDGYKIWGDALKKIL